MKKNGYCARWMVCVAPFALFLGGAIDAPAACTVTPKPAVRADVSQNSTVVVLTADGCSFDKDTSKLTFAFPGDDGTGSKMTVGAVTWNDATDVTTTFTLSADASKSIDVLIGGLDGGTASARFAFATGVDCSVTLDPPARTNTSDTSVPVTLTASDKCIFDKTATIKITVTGGDGKLTKTITANPAKYVDDTHATATLKVSNDAWGTVRIIAGGMHTDAASTTNFTSGSGTFDTGVACLEAISTQHCALRWEVDTTAATGSSSQTNNTTAPNFLFKLDWQIAKNKDTSILARNKLKLLQGTSVPGKLQNQTAHPNGAATPTDRLNAHLIFKTGYTQVNSATKIQPTTTNSSTMTTNTTTASTTAPATATTPCTGTASSSTTAPSTCTAAIQQQAFVAEAGGTVGWVLGRDGQGTFAEIGFGGRGSFQNLVQSDQVVQSGGISYVNLKTLNPRDAIGMYEGVARFALSSIGHDTPADSTTGNYHNVSNLLVIEAGFQNNSGLQGIAGPQTNTRDRFVGRFYATPELPGSATHSKFLIGMEFSGGINGGPKTVQIFFGANLNPSKLFSGNKATTSTGTPTGN